jgi:hypothetical protein
MGVGVSGGEVGLTLAMLGAALLMAGLALWLRFTQPVAYRIEPGALVIQRRRGERRISGRVARHAEKATLGLRMGSGGVYGYRGWFRVNGGGWARTLVTDVRRAVLIRVGGRPVVISPADPTAFLAEVPDA